MVEIIAEIGSSPAPDWDFDKWCSAVRRCGATHIKAQMFKAEHFPKAEQASKKPLEFPRGRIQDFVAAAHSRGLRVGVSVFDTVAVEIAAKHCDFLKLAAREQDNRELVTLTSFASMSMSQKPRFYRSISSMESIIPNMFLGIGATTLWTAQEYPRPIVHALLDVVYCSAILNINHRGKWGYSSHSTSWLDCWLAAKLGAATIEKHLALTPQDLEAGHSLLPREFKRMCEAINGNR